MKIMRKIIEIDDERCDGCGQCVPACAEGAIQVIDGKARVIEDRFCDGLGACLGECPNGALRVIEREADEFDEEAVEEHLAHSVTAPEPAKTMACGCPSAQIQSFEPRTPCQMANAPQQVAGEASALSHWPVQIRLVPPDAPFLKNADLLILADCAAVAYPTLHRDFLKGKVVLMGCPKFDDAEAYMDKFTAIFRTAKPRSITSVFMEVPCCGGLPMMVRKALAAAGGQIPHQEVVIACRGKILDRNAA
ncbi:MAG: ATP-binding protein [Thermodesulfobacteriota bacterium]